MGIDYAKFRLWCAELEKRAAEHVRKHPEHKGTLSPLAIIPKEKFRVKILESVAYPGTWSVYVNDVKQDTFFGMNAHQLAIDAMKALLERNQ